MPHRHGSGWRGSVQVPGAGTMRQGGFATKAAAARWERDTAADLERGTWRDPLAGAITFQDWSKRWLMTRSTLKPGSREQESSIVTIHLIPAFGSVRLDELGPLAVETLISRLTETRAPKTVRNVHGVLHNVMALAVREGLIVSNPCAGTRLPEGERRKVMACLTEQQLAQLFDTVPPYWRPLLVTLAGTGLRWGEAVGLRAKYVDLLAGELSVRETLNPTATRWGTPKTKAGRRTIGLPAAVVDVLLPLVAGKEGDEPVFTMPDGSLIKHRWFNYTIWKPVCKTLGIVATIHDLRHSHVAILIANGEPLSAIKARVGHESINTTDKMYGYLLPRVERQLLRGLDRALGGSTMGDVAPGKQQMIELLTTHGDHVLGFDPADKRHLRCATCDVRLGSNDLFVEITDTGSCPHPRFSTDPAVREEWARQRAAERLEQPRLTLVENSARPPGVPGDLGTDPT